MTPLDWFDIFQKGALVAVVLAFMLGYIVPKPTHDDVKAQRDSAQQKTENLINTVADMKGVMSDAVEVMKDVTTALNKPAGSPSPRKTSGGS